MANSRTRWAIPPGSSSIGTWPTSCRVRKLGGRQGFCQRPPVTLEGEDAVLRGPGQKHGATDLIEVVGVLVSSGAQQLEVGGALHRRAEAVHRVGGLEPLGLSGELTEQQPPPQRRAAKQLGVREQSPPERTPDPEAALDSLHRAIPGAPTSRRCQGHDGARPSSLRQLQREPAAQRVPDDVRPRPAEDVELALEPIGQRSDPRRDAGGKELALEVPEQGGGEHFEGVFEFRRDRLPDPPRRGEAVE